jgi:hypothetical protein
MCRQFGNTAEWLASSARADAARNLSEGVVFKDAPQVHREAPRRDSHARCYMPVPVQVPIATARLGLWADEPSRRAACLSLGRRTNLPSSVSLRFS